MATPGEIVKALGAGFAGLVGTAVGGLIQIDGLPLAAVVGALVVVPVLAGLVLLGRVVLAADEDAAVRLERLLRLLLDRPDPFARPPAGPRVDPTGSVDTERRPTGLRGTG